MNKSLEEVIENCHSLLKNNEGMYHGWFTLTCDKYGYGWFSAWATLNPPESDIDFKYIRSITPIFEGESALEVMTSLMDWLIEWRNTGQKYKENEKYN